MRKLTFAFLSFFLIGCTSGKQSDRYAGWIELPTEAVNMKDIGGGWYEFDYGQNKFIIKSDGHRSYGMNAGPSDRIKQELDEIGNIIEENIRKNRIRPFSDGLLPKTYDDPAPAPPTEKQNSI